MSLPILAMLLTAALFHATWNLLLKQIHDRLLVTWWSMAISSVASLPILLLYVTLDGLKKLGCAIDPDDAGAYMHAWKVVGAVMGVDEALLPRNAADAEALLLAIQRRHFEPCPEGRQLTRALVEMLQESTRGSPFERLPVSTMRYLLGDQIGDVLILPMRVVNRVASEVQTRLPPLPQLAEPFGCQVIDGRMRMNRGGNRADFRLPTALRG